MSKPDAIHEDPDRLREALRHTAALMGFRVQLIEKDYYCSLVLQDLADLFQKGGLVFKGGTCLSKVHTSFSRLSEDLDFSVSVPLTASRPQRRAASKAFRAHLDAIDARLPCFRIDTPQTVHDEHRQFNWRLAYRSVETGEDDFVKVEVGVREEVLYPVELDARTLLAGPAMGGSLLHPIKVKVLSLQEAYAEKVRAALTRREPAIRDFFDVDHAVEKGYLKHLAPEFLELVSRKLSAARDPAVLSSSRQEELRAQLETQLKPVLREADYAAFSLDRVWELLKAVSAALPKG